jgi:hypothetical protein
VQLGDEENFLRIKSRPIIGSHTRLEIEAVATSTGCRFSVVHDSVLCSSSEQTMQRLADFTALVTSEFEVQLSEGGWLRFIRDLRGYVMVRYRVASERASAAAEGEIMVEGEFTQQLCRDVAALLKGKS